MKKILLTALTTLSLFSVSNMQTDLKVVSADETIYTTTLYEIKEVSNITQEASFQSDYFDLSETKIRAIPFATSYDDLLINELLGNEKSVLEENSNIYRVYDSDGYSYTLTFDYANSHYYFNSSYDGNIKFYSKLLLCQT